MIAYYLVKDGVQVGHGFVPTRNLLPTEDQLPEGVQVQFTPAPLSTKRSYVSLRTENYPCIADQLDAIWKGGEDMEAMRQRVLDVKARYPKQ